MMSIKYTNFKKLYWASKETNWHNSNFMTTCTRSARQAVKSWRFNWTGLALIFMVMLPNERLKH